MHAAEDAHANDQVQAELLAQASHMWNGTELPAYPTEEPEVSILKVTIPPHTQLPWHKHPSINAGYMIKGELTVESEAGEVLHLKAGDTLVELVDQWHYGRNDGDEPVEIVVFYAGSKGVPLAIKRPVE